VRTDEGNGEASVRSRSAHGESFAPTSVRFVTDPIRASVVPDFEELPDYAASLLAYHRSHAEMLAGMIDALPVEPGQRWLDLATGDGTYAMLLAEKQANVVATDSDERYLAFARSRAQRRGLRIELRAGDAYRLPFADGELDGAFFAQSFYDRRAGGELHDDSARAPFQRRALFPGASIDGAVSDGRRPIARGGARPRACLLHAGRAAIPSGSAFLHRHHPRLSGLGSGGLRFRGVAGSLKTSAQRLRTGAGRNVSRASAVQHSAD
jgi:SAM-dependent methyltransferase